MNEVTVAIVITTQVFVLIAMCYIFRVLKLLVVDYQQQLRDITAELELWAKTDAKTDTATVAKENFPSAE